MSTLTGKWWQKRSPQRSHRVACEARGTTLVPTTDHTSTNIKGTLYKQPILHEDPIIAMAFSIHQTGSDGKPKVRQGRRLATLWTQQCLTNHTATLQITTLSWLNTYTYIRNNHRQCGDMTTTEHTDNSPYKIQKRPTSTEWREGCLPPQSTKPTRRKKEERTF